MVGLGIGIGLKLGVALKAMLAGIAVVAVVTVLTWERLKTYFQANRHLVTADRDNVAFSMTEKLKSKRYRTVYGVYNERTGKIVDAESVESQSLDDTLRSFHDDEPVVLYR